MIVELSTGSGGTCISRRYAVDGDGNNSGYLFVEMLDWEVYRPGCIMKHCLHPAEGCISTSFDIELAEIERWLASAGVAMRK